jgi:hypothetical protein
MLNLKIKVGHYYTLKLSQEITITFAVLYEFERGKNKDVYSLRIFNNKRDFEFPVEESTFNKWVKEERIKEITPEEALMQAIQI